MKDHQVIELSPIGKYDPQHPDLPPELPFGRSFNNAVQDVENHRLKEGFSIVPHVNVQED